MKSSSSGGGRREVSCVSPLVERGQSFGGRVLGVCSCASCFRGELHSCGVRVAGALALASLASVPRPPSLGCAVLRVSPAELVRVIVSAVPPPVHSCDALACPLAWWVRSVWLVSGARACGPSPRPSVRPHGNALLLIPVDKKSLELFQSVSALRSANQTIS